MPPRTAASRSGNPAKRNAASNGAAKSRRAALDAATLTIGEEDVPAVASAVKVNLVGKVYSVTPPKSAAAMRLASLASDRDSDPDETFAALDKWIDHAFGAKAEEIRERMYEDDDDPLDFGHIMALMQKLVEMTSGLPTTRR